MKPIGQILRERKRAEGASSSTTKKKKSSQVDNVKISLEEQIRLLETELAVSGDDASGGDSSDDSSSDQDDGGDKDESAAADDMIYERDANGNIIRIISKICVDAIEPLSESQLPQPMCSKGSKQKASFKLLKQLKPITKTLVRFADDQTIDNEDVTDVVQTEDEIESGRIKLEENKRKKLEQKEKKKRPRTDEEKIKKEGEEEKKVRISGLEKTVRELLVNYIPASIEKKAFYCRICRTESVDIESFESHKTSEFHIVAVKMEKKMSFCVLCRKQFTSPNQLTEHLAGRGHKDYLATVKEKQLLQKQMKKFR
jgi:hypothetical protein